MAPDFDQGIFLLDLLRRCFLRRGWSSPRLLHALAEKLPLRVRKQAIAAAQIPVQDQLPRVDLEGKTASLRERERERWARTSQK